MINRAHRFHGHASLRFVYQRGETIRGPLLSTKYALNARRKGYRLAIVVSKKVSKSAVQRNRIRRRIYEHVRLLDNQIRKPYDVVITVFSDQLVELPSDELRSLVVHQLKQAHILTTATTPVHGKIDQKENQ